MKRLELVAVLLLCHLLSSSQRPCQPITTTLTGPAKGLPGIGIKVFNGYPSHTLSNRALEWEVTLNGSVVQKGKVPVLTVAPQHSGTIRLPARIPASPGEVFLNISYRVKKPEPSLPAGSIVAWEQLRLRDYVNDLSVHPAGELSFADSGGTFTITSAATALNLQFNKQTGWLQHYAMGARQLVADSSGLITDLGHSPAPGQEPRLQLFSTSTSTDMAVVKADYLIPETPLLLHARYTVNAKGEMQVEQFLEVDTTQPRDTAAGPSVVKYPPLFGMKWILPASFDSVIYYGAVPATDSCHRTRTDIYHPPADDTGTWTDIRWCKLTDGLGHGLLIAADSSLLNLRMHGRQLNIDHPYTGPDKDSYHYIYIVRELVSPEK